MILFVFIFSLLGLFKFFVNTIYDIRKCYVKVI